MPADRVVDGPGLPLAPRRSGFARMAAVCALALAVAVLCGPAVAAGAFELPFGDFEWHAQTAARMAAGGDVEVPHWLFAALLTAVNTLRAEPEWVATGAAIALVCEVVLAVILASALQQVLPGSAPLAALCAAALLVVQPITLASWAERNLYLGYIAVNAHHNPTLLLLRPLALGQWLLAAAALTRSRPAPPLAVGGAALLSLAATLAKPSYAIVLLPALAVVAGLRGRKRVGDPHLLAWGVVAPTGAVLAWQFAQTFGAGQGAIAWAPFQVMGKFPGSPARVLAAAAFPLAALLAFWRAARRDLPLALAWCAFGFGLAYAYLLAESGEREQHANFLWSAQVALFLLFVASARLVLREGARRSPGSPLRLLACGSVLALHLASGVFFLMHPTWV